jgi:predicted dehydrogenase
VTDRSLDPAALGVAAVGNSFMGRAHSNPWHNARANFDVPSLEQRVLVGRDKGRVRGAPPRCGWHDWATRWRSAIERDNKQIADICRPKQWMHAKIAIDALEAGKHVLVEEPLANSLAESEALVSPARAARAPGVQCMMHSNYDNKYNRTLELDN